MLQASFEKCRLSVVFFLMFLHLLACYSFQLVFLMQSFQTAKCQAFSMYIVQQSHFFRESHTFLKEQYHEISKNLLRKITMMERGHIKVPDGRGTESAQPVQATLLPQIGPRQGPTAELCCYCKTPVLGFS